MSSLVPIAAIVTASNTRRSQALLAYVSNAKKDQQGSRYVAQSGVNGTHPEWAEDQFRANRRRWGKDGTRTVVRDGRKIREAKFVQAYHVVQSFARDGVGSLDPDSPDDWESAHEIGIQLAKRVAGDTRFATVTTQIDGKTGCIHNHIVVDSICRETGKSLDGSIIKHSNLAKEHDELLTSMGYEQQNTLGKAKVVKEKGEERDLEKFNTWLNNDQVGPATTDMPFSVGLMKKLLAGVLNKTSYTNFDEFVKVAKDNFIIAERRGKRGLTYTLLRSTADGSTFRKPVPGDRRRASKLGSNFMLDAVEAAIERNIEIQKQDHLTQQKQDRLTQRRQNRVTQRRRNRVTQQKAPVTVLATTTTPLSRPSPTVQTSTKKLTSTVDEKTVKENIKATSTATAMDVDITATATAMAVEHIKPVSKDIKDVPTATAIGTNTTATATAMVVEDNHETVAETDDRTLDATALSVTTPSTATAMDGARKQQVVPKIDYGKPTVKPAEQYRSALRDAVSRNHKRQRLLIETAEFDELAAGYLDAGKRFPHEELPVGIGPEFLKDYGEMFDPRIYEILQQRNTKLTKASELYEQGITTPGPLGTYWRENASRMRKEVKAGDYYVPDKKKTAQKRVPYFVEVEHQHADNEVSLG